MSNGETSSEDLTLLAAVEALERGTGSPAPRPGQSAETETLSRLYTEVLGLLPFELDPVAPSPEVRTRLMALVHGDETQPAAEPAPAAVPPRPSPETRAPRPMSPGRPVAALVRRPSRWPLALAAALALTAIGLSGWLYLQGLQLGQQRQTIAQLRQEVAAERARTEKALAEARDLQGASKGDLADLREKFALVTSRGVAVAPMRPMGRPPRQPQARGILFVAANHQHWYMSLEGLRPAEPGQTYKLWFLADQGPVDAGSFTARPGEPIELSSKHMPAGTRGAMVTLEQDPQAPRPGGLEILRAAAMYPVS